MVVLNRIFITFSMLGLMAAATPVYAQERAAGGTVDIQTTWTSLSNLVKAANQRSEAVDARVNQIVKCNKKFKLYAPGEAGADGDGCIENALIKQLTARMDKAETDIKDTNTKLTALDSKVTQNLSRIDGDIAGLKTKLDALTGRVNVAEADIRNLNTSMLALTEKVNELSARVDNVYNTLNTRISNEVTRINGLITGINGQIADLYNRTNDLYNRTNDLYGRTNDLYSKTAALEAAVNAIRNCGSQLKLTNTSNKCVDLPFQKETEYVETPGWISSPLTLACTLGRKITYAMGNVSTRSNQLACGRSGANCDGNGTATLAGKTSWTIVPDPGKVVSAYIECK